MRQLILFFALLLPQLVSGQFNRFATGSYQLVATPTTRQVGEMKLINGNELRVKDAAGKKLNLSPQEVLSLRLGPHHYTTEEVEVAEGVFGTTAKYQFVELLDSGQVLLMRYDYFVMSGATNSQEINRYLLRGQQQPIATAFYFNWLGTGKKLSEAVLPYLADRPDLAQIVTQKRLSVAELQALVHALNTGLAYSKPLVLPFGVE